MSTSATPPGPSSSTPSLASTSFPRDMVGCHVKLFRLYREGRVSGVDREEGEQELTLIKFITDGAISPGDNLRMETAGGLKFHGTVNLDKTSTEASILVKDGSVRSCRCCRELGVPAPPFSPSMVGMKVHFCEPDPHTFGASVLEVEKRPTLSVVNLKMTSAPLYSLRMGDRIIVSSGLDTWGGTVMYFEDEGYVRNLQNKICIHVLDEQVPQGPKCLPYTKILVRPAERCPSIGAVRHKGKEDSQRKRKSSAHEEKEANQKKIKVAINGYRDVGRALARVALDSEYVDLVAINDPSITDQASCMFQDSKCDFEVKSSSSSILSFGQKEVTFFRESDSSRVDWYMARTQPQLVVTGSYCNKNEQAYYEQFVYRNSEMSDPRLFGPLEIMLGTCNSSTTPRNSWAPVLTIRPISASDAKAVGDCFPLWRGEPLVSIVRFQGTDVIFELGPYPHYPTLRNSTQPSIDFTQLVRWCFHMLRRIPDAVCDVELSEWPRRG